MFPDRHSILKINSKSHLGYALSGWSDQRIVAAALGEISFFGDTPEAKSDIFSDLFVAFCDSGIEAADVVTICSEMQWELPAIFTETFLLPVNAAFSESGNQSVTDINSKERLNPLERRKWLEGFMRLDPTKAGRERGPNNGLDGPWTRDKWLVQIQSLGSPSRNDALSTWRAASQTVGGELANEGKRLSWGVGGAPTKNR